MKISVIVAMARNRVIGRDNSLIWHLPADLRHFRETTMGQPVIMGRKTYESVGKPLPGRTNIIVTRRKGYSAEGCLVAGSLEAAIRMAESSGSSTGSSSGKDPDKRNEPGPGNEIFIAGGGEIYRDAIPLAGRMYITVIDEDFEGDTFFPAFDEDKWQIAGREHYPADERNPHSMTFITWERNESGTATRNT